MTVLPSKILGLCLLLFLSSQIACTIKSKGGNTDSDNNINGNGKGFGGESEEPPANPPAGRGVLDLNHARARCNSQEKSPTEHLVLCQAVFMDDKGNEFVPTPEEVDKTFTFAWKPSISISGTQVQSESCQVTKSGITQECDVTLTTIAVTSLRYDVEITDTKLNQNKTVSDVVTLILTAETYGEVPQQLTVQPATNAKTKNLQSDEKKTEAMGFQSPALDLFKNEIGNINSFCVQNNRIFFSAGNYIYALEKSDKEEKKEEKYTLQLYAGSARREPDYFVGVEHVGSSSYAVRAPRDLSHRLRVSMGPPPRTEDQTYRFTLSLICTSDSIYVLDYNRLLRIRDNGPVTSTLFYNSVGILPGLTGISVHASIGPDTLYYQYAGQVFSVSTLTPNSPSPIKKIYDDGRRGTGTGDGLAPPLILKDGTLLISTSQNAGSSQIVLIHLDLEGHVLDQRKIPNSVFRSLTLDSDGTAYYMGGNPGGIRKFAPDGTDTLVVQNPRSDSPYANWISGLARSERGEFYFTEGVGTTLRAVMPGQPARDLLRTTQDLMNWTVASTPEDPKKIHLLLPTGLAFSPSNGLAITDGHGILRHVDSNGRSSTILLGRAGSESVTSQALPTTTEFHASEFTRHRVGGITYGPDGTLYFADNQLYRLGANQKIQNLTPDYVPVPEGRTLTSDSSGNLYYATPGQGAALVKRTPEGNFSILVDGLAGPLGVAVGPDHSVYFSDTQKHQIKKIDTSGKLSLIAGNGYQGDTGNGGWATQAALNLPKGLAVLADGTILIADSGNSRIQILEPVMGTNGRVAYKVDTFIGKLGSTDCGGSLNQKIIADKFDSTYRASVSTLCVSTPETIIAKASCENGMGHIEIAYSQDFEMNFGSAIYNPGSVVRIKRAWDCQPKQATLAPVFVCENGELSANGSATGCLGVLTMSEFAIVSCNDGTGRIEPNCTWVTCQDGSQAISQDECFKNCLDGSRIKESEACPASYFCFGGQEVGSVDQCPDTP